MLVSFSVLALAEPGANGSDSGSSSGSSSGSGGISGSIGLQAIATSVLQAPIFRMTAAKHLVRPQYNIQCLFVSPNMF